MITDIWIYILLALISFLPIVVWGYIFSYVDDNPLNKRRFGVGIIGWILSVIPILYFDRLLWVFDFKYLNTFAFVSQIKDFVSSLEFGLSLSLFVLVIALFSFFVGGLVHKFRNISKIYFKNMIVFFLFIVILSVIMFWLHYVLWGIDIPMKESIYFQNIVFNSFKLVVFYYVVVAFVEEASKHFNFLQSSVLYIKNIQSGVLYAIFVALWFSFIENVLYLYTYYGQYGVGGDLLKIYFFRWAFSTIVHVLSSSVVAYYFSRALLQYREKDLSFPYIKLFCFGIFLSIFLHLIFDVAMSFWFTLIMFIYFIWGYLYVSSLFYREE